MRADLPGGQPLGIQRQHHLIDVGQPALPLGDDDRGERAVAVPRHVDGHLTAGIAEHRLGALAVTGVPPVPAGRGVLVIAQVLGHLRLQGGLEHPLGDLVQQPSRAHQIDSLRFGLGQELLCQLPLVHHLISRHSINRVSHDLYLSVRPDPDPPLNRQSPKDAGAAYGRAESGYRSPWFQ